MFFSGSKITNCLEFYVHCTVYTIFHCTVYSVRTIHPFTVYSVHNFPNTVYTVYAIHPLHTMYNVQYVPLYNVQCYIYRIYCTVYTIHPCKVYCVHYTSLFKMHCCIQGITRGHMWVTTEKCQLYKYDNVNICIHYFTTNS